MGLIADIHRDLEKGALQLMVEYRARLHAEAVKLCGDEAQAEDLVFRTFERVLAKADAYKEDINLFAWMKAIMENIHKNDVKRPVVRGTMALEAAELEKCAGADWSSDEQILKNSDSEAVRTALRQIDPEFKRLVLMHYYDDFTLREIANVLNMPISTVGRRMQMALRILAGKLEAEFNKAKPKLALLGAFLLAGSLFGAAAWGVVEAVSAVRSLGSEVALESEEPETALESEGSFGSEGMLGSGSAGDPIDPKDPASDPIAPNDTTVPSPLSATGAGTTGAVPLSTTENTNTKEKETMNLKSITKSAAKLAVGAALTTGASTAMADGWFYADGAITDSNGIRCPVSANGSLLTVNSGTSFSGVTDIDFSKPIVDGAGNAYAIGAIADAAFYSSAVTSIRLPDTITTIGGFAFQFCTAITNITPFLPSSVTQIGIKAFNGATNLRGELTIGVSGTDFSFGGEQVFDSASSVTSLVLDGTLASMPSAEFYNCTSLEKVVIGEGTQVIGTFAFQMCTVLKSVEFKGYSNWAADSSFKTIPDYQVLFEVPSGDVQWKTFLENAGNVTPWDGLGPDVQQKFYDVHGAATNDPVPYGLVSPSVGGGSTQWIAYKRASGSKYHLQVVGERDGQPFDVGVLSPAYGSFENDVLPTPCRCEVLETNVCGETALYECYGHEFAQFDGGTAVDVRTNLSLTCQFAPEAGGSYRVKWLWRRLATS